MVSRIEDVALAAGVSTATVSRALRGLPRVSEATRARVLRVAEELQYVASPTASSLASGKTHVVGVVVPYVTRWYFAQLISGVSGVLREQGFHALLFDVGDEGPQRPLLLDSRMLFKRVDAVVILSLRLHEDERRLLRRLKIPVVTIGVPDPDWPCIRIDDVRTTRLATQHLLGLGHRRIGYVGGVTESTPDFPTPADRAKGVRESLRQAGTGLAPEHTVVADWTPAGGLRAGHELLGRPDRPTAVVCASDEIAFGVLRAAADLGLAVPGDLSVTGIDGHAMAELYGLTTVTQDPTEQGRTATRLLLGAIAGQDVGSEVDTMATSLVVRASTAAPRP
jgi:LacI family transcriptional regulator, repressor for deo operon, udp, cdd, tsx, nupC, and nupG